MKEHYCTYEQSQALKRLGFIEEVDHIYLRAKKDESFEFADWKVDDANYNKRTRPQLAISAPRLDQAAAWIWDKYKLWIEVTIKAKNDLTLCIVDEYGEVKFIGDGKDSIPNTYIAGIDKALELLGKEVKE